MITRSVRRIAVVVALSLVAGGVVGVGAHAVPSEGRDDTGDEIQARYRHTTPYFDLVLLTSPARIESLAIDPAGQGRHMGVINNYGRMGSSIFASYGSFSNVESNAVMAGRPERVVVSDDELRLEGLPVGSQGLVADWAFTFADKTFDVTLDWTVEEPQTNLWEAGWKLDGVARSIGDHDGADLPPGDRGPFVAEPGAYLAWSEVDPRYAHTLVTAFAPGSAALGDNVYVEPQVGRPVTWAVWQTVWAPGGTSLDAGTLRGGRWRVGASGEANDRDYAAALAAEVAGGPQAVPAPGAGPVASQRDAAVAFGRRLAAPASWQGREQVRSGPNSSLTLSNGRVLAAFVPDGDAYRSWLYAAEGNRWQLAAAAGPTRRFTEVADSGDGTLAVGAEGIGPAGDVETTTQETWSIRGDGGGRERPGQSSGSIHVVSTDSPVDGHTAHPMHSYLAYPGGQTKTEIGDYDVLASPHLRPQADLIVGQRALWAPALQVQEVDTSVALIPDLLVHRTPGNFAEMPTPGYFGPSLDLDVANRLVDAPQLSFGWRTTEGAFDYYYRDVGETPVETVKVAYDLVVRAGAPDHSVVSDVQRRLWDQVGRRYFEQSRLPQTQPANRAFDEAWSQWEQMYDSRVVDGVRLGAVRIDREFPPDANFMSWFNALRSSYGLFSQGRERGDEELMAKGRSTLDLLLSAPREQGAFPTIAGFRDEGFEWFGSHKNFLNQMPWGPTSYATFDMGWAAYWVLRWYQDLVEEPRALEFATSYGDFLLDQQLPNGAVPSWIAIGTFEIDPHLRESAQTASSVMFLAELARVTGDDRYLTAAERAARYVTEHHLNAQRWDDFEPYYSNAPKSEGAADPFSGESAQNTLSMHFAALGYLTLYELTGNQRWLDDGQRAVDTYLQYQYVTPGLGLSLNSFGGFAVQNTDNEAVDARQSQFGLTLLDYARETGRADYAQRGIAAIRAGYSTMASPSAEILNPRFLDAFPVGRGPENYAHATFDTPAGFTVFDWGQGSAAAGFAEARNRFGDVWVDGRHGTAYGIDNVHVEEISLRGANLSLELTSPAPDHVVTLKADGLRVARVRLQVNGGPARMIDREELEAGVEVPTKQEVRIVHNPFRTDIAVAAEPFTVSALISDDNPVQEATLHYRSENQSWSTLGMTQQDDQTWVGTIPGAAVHQDERLEYYLTASTASGTGQAPEVDPAQVPFVQHPTTAHVVETAAYRAVIGTGEEAAILSVGVDPDGDGEFRRVMDTSFRSTVPYAAVGNFGDTDRPGPPERVEISQDGRDLRLTGIPIGDEPVTVDWTFRFDDDSFDHSLEWHVTGPTNAPVWELGWNWDTALSRVGDPAILDRPVGDVSGFSDWVMAHGDEGSLVAAYRNGSAWSEDNRWFNPPGENIAWQSLWQPGGRELQPGDYPGGTWRIGASARPADTDYADRLHAALNE